MSQVNVSDTVVQASEEPQLLAESEVFDLEEGAIDENGQLNEQAMTKALQMLDVSSGAKKINLTNRMRRQMERMRMQPILDERERQRKLDEWRRKPNEWRMVSAEVHEAAASQGFSLKRTYLSRVIRGAMQSMRYRLGVV